VSARYESLIQGYQEDGQVGSKWGEGGGILIVRQPGGKIPVISRITMLRRRGGKAGKKGQVKDPYLLEGGKDEMNEEMFSPEGVPENRKRGEGDYEAPLSKRGEGLQQGVIRDLYDGHG